MNSFEKEECRPVKETCLRIPSASCTY